MNADAKDLALGITLAAIAYAAWKSRNKSIFESIIDGSYDISIGSIIGAWVMVILL